MVGPVVEKKPEAIVQVPQGAKKEIERSKDLPHILKDKGKKYVKPRGRVFGD